jgi:hypothetical protein
MPDRLILPVALLRLSLALVLDSGSRGEEGTLMNVRSTQKLFTTDVLVVGAGMAGFFAAIKAKERGADVTLVDKAYAGKAGSTHFSEGDIVFFRPERGHKVEEWLKVISTNCEYLRDFDAMSSYPSVKRRRNTLSLHRLWSMSHPGCLRVPSGLRGLGSPSSLLMSQWQADIQE